MFCKFCGNQIDDNSVFCSKCGKTLQAGDSAGQGDIPAQTPIVPQQIPAAPPQVPAAPSSKNNTLKIVLIIVFAVLFLGLAAIGGYIFVMYKAVSGEAVSEKSISENGENDLTGKTFTAQLPNGVKLEMVRIPNCKKDGFMMGSPESEADRKDDETRHKVYLTKDFYLGKYEVTQAQWQALMGTDVYQQKNKGNMWGDVTGVGGQHPMYFVNYNEALDFCNELNKRGYAPEGWKFTLPTEAQWEYACRAGTTTPFSYGSRSDVYKMNFAGNYPYGGAGKGVYRDSTVEVGSLGYKNAFGLYDMHGNVWEWCLDHYSSRFYSNGATDPLCTTGSGRVLRGGSWRDRAARDCRSACRGGGAPTYRIYYVGFRLALVPSQ